MKADRLLWAWSVPESGVSGWGSHCYPTQEIKDAIRHHNIEKTVNLENGMKEIEVYDPEMRLLERKPFPKPKAESSFLND